MITASWEASDMALVLSSAALRSMISAERRRLARATTKSTMPATAATASTASQIRFQSTSRVTWGLAHLSWMMARSSAEILAMAFSRIEARGFKSFRTAKPRAYS